MIGAAHLDVDTQADPVIALQQEVQEFVNSDVLSILVAFGKIVALHHARHRMLCGQADHALGAEHRRDGQRAEDFQVLGYINWYERCTCRDVRTNDFRL